MCPFVNTSLCLSVHSSTRNLSHPNLLTLSRSPWVLTLTLGTASALKTSRSSITATPASTTTPRAPTASENYFLKTLFISLFPILSRFEEINTVPESNPNFVENARVEDLGPGL